MSESASFSDRALALIDQITEMTLKGQIRSNAQIYQLLVDGVIPGSGEIFERCLGDRLAATQRDVEVQTDELKLAKASRRLRALQTIEKEWQRWQAQYQVAEQLTRAVNQIQQAPDELERLRIFLQVMDPNRERVLSLQQWETLAKQLSQVPADAEAESAEPLQELATGIQQGLHTWHQLENDLVSWLYDQAQGQLGFGGIPGQRGPWALWSQKVLSPRLKALFQTLALEQSVVAFAAEQSGLTLADWVEIMVVLRCLQQGLVSWFDRLVYDSKVGAKLSISTFLAFAVIWSQLASGFNQVTTLNVSSRDRLVQGCFQVTLQILRAFAQRDYFPIYGGLFASFSGTYLRDALSYLDEPLQQAEGTTEKARVLTLLGYSQRALGRYDLAYQFHQQALVIAQAAEDSVCQIANFNHLSRIHVAQKEYTEAINYSQRALILARQTGDRLGEANALANLGYSEVFRANQIEQADPAVYETATQYLQQGLQLAERLGDRQSQALCLSSLGVTCLVTGQPQGAIAYLEGGIQAAQFSGDLYLQSINLSHLAEAYYQLEQWPKTLLTGSVAMYLLEQLASREWRQAAGLLTVLQGKLGEEAFQTLQQEQRSQIIAMIGVDGYDYLPQLLQHYLDDEP